MYLILALIFLFLFGYSTLHAQFTDTTPYYINANANGTINNTNDGNSYVLSNNLKFSVSRKGIALNTNNSYLYGMQIGKLTNNDFKSVTDVNLLKDVRKIYYWALLGYDKSLSLQITDKLQAGAGIGYHVFNRKGFVLTLTDGPLYEYNDLYTLEAYQTVRNSFRVKFDVNINELLRLEGATFLQNSFKNANDYIILSNTSLSLKIYRWFRFSASVVYNRININARENLLVNFGIIYERYFR